MKKILLTVVLGVAVGAVAQSTAAPPQGQSATPPAPAQAAAPAAAPQTPAAAPQTPAATPQTAAPVIKDPAEYNAYVGAVQQTDPNAKISGLEAFLTQYPNSVMKNQALEILMQTYQQANNAKKTMETGAKLVAVDPCQVRALALLAYFDRVLAQAGDPNAKQFLADGKKYGQQGIDCMPKFNKPEGTSEADFQKLKDQMNGIFSAAIGIAALTDKDYPTATKTLRVAVDGSPQEFGLVYPLALAYLQSTPQNLTDGIWFGARAVAIAPSPQVVQTIEPYLKRQYAKYHGGDDGWTEFVALAKGSATEPQTLPVKPAPTPAEQVHIIVTSKKPEEMSFAEWQFVFTNGSQEDQDMVWNAIKGKAVQMNGSIISTEPTEFMIAGSSDDIDAKKADITLKFEEKIPVRMIPKDGASFDFQGSPASYTPNPFMMVMEKGTLLKPKAAPPATKKPPVHRKPAAQ